MKYKFPKSLDIDYAPLDKYLKEGETISKAALLERCAGEISLPLLNYLRELEFENIGKTQAGELYIT